MKRKYFIENNGAPRKKRKLAAIMVTDVVGYSELTHRDETLALKLLEEHRALSRPVFSAHGGIEVKTIGDAFLVEFASAFEAVDCAIELQKLHAARNEAAGPDKKLTIRIGVHLGDVIQTIDRTDLHGDGVNIASRLQTCAEPGGVCISQQVYDQVHNKIENTLVEIADSRLRNSESPVRAYRILSGTSRSKRAVSAKPSTVLIPIAGIPLGLLILAGIFFWSSKIDKSDRMPASQNLRIAVLPFDNISLTADDGYLSDGMTEELISSLAKLPALKVVARTSVMKYKGTNRKTVADIGKELNVSTVLEGSVRRAKDRLRVSVKLIDVKSQESIWSHEYDGELSMLFDFQKAIADKIISELRSRFTASPTAAEAGETLKTNSEAYSSYLKGRYYLAKRTPDGMRKSADFFKHATELDPKFAAAYAERAAAYVVMSFYDVLVPKTALVEAKALAEKALSLNPNSSEALTALGEATAYYSHDWSAAEKYYRRALELKPGFALGHHWYGEYLAGIGHQKEAISETQLALELDPLSPNINTAMGHPYYYAGQFNDAIKAYRKSLDIEPNFYLTHVWLARSYASVQKYDEALASLDRADILAPDSLVLKMERAKVLAASGKREAARKIASDLRSLSRKNYVSSYGLAEIYAELGDQDNAIHYLEVAIDESATRLIYLNHDPTFRKLKGNKKFTAILKRAGFTQ